AGRGGRQREGRDRVAPGRGRRRRGALEAGCLGGKHPAGAASMKLGVEAALVEGRLVRGDMEISAGRISAVGLGSPNGRGIAVPGFVDLQVNGFAGVDLLDADTEGYRRAGEALLETGVTSYLPTFITAPEDRL